MKFELRTNKVEEIVNAWKSGSLIRNPEYQRGETWTEQQKQALTDSILRDYPIPPLFIEEKIDPGLGGAPVQRWEIVDGQQRVIALSEFCSDAFELLAPESKKLRLPKSMRGQAVRWAGRRFTNLDADLKQKVENTELNVYYISEVSQPDEVRDLFIRLQSGTALTRQQVRDAWPGNLGPFIETLAGKLAKRPGVAVFRFVDGRGTRDDEGDDKDPYAKHRQTCAQVLRLLLARSQDPSWFPSVSASDLDGLYHEYTDFDVNGATAREIWLILGFADQVCARLDGKVWGRRKIPKQGLFALVMFLQDITKNPLSKLDAHAFGKLAHYITEGAPKPSGRSTSGPAIQEYYEEWRGPLPQGIGVALDPKRDFDPQQRAEIKQKTQGNCAICKEPVDEEEAEYDHFPIMWRDGGKTVVENGRLVHERCHPRGRPRTDE